MHGYFPESVQNRRQEDCYDNEKIQGLWFQVNHSMMLTNCDGKTNVLIQEEYLAAKSIDCLDNINKLV